MNRRTLLLAAPTLAMGTHAMAAADGPGPQSTGGLKVTVLYGHPQSPEEFEKYYFGTHMPLVNAAKAGKRAETAKCLPAADGSPAPYYRIFEIWFDSQAEMSAITSTPEWKKVVEDVRNFATGGMTRVLSRTD